MAASKDYFTGDAGPVDKVKYDVDLGYEDSVGDPAPGPLRKGSLPVSKLNAKSDGSPMISRGTPHESIAHPSGPPGFKKATQQTVNRHRIGDVSHSAGAQPANSGDAGMTDADQPTPAGPGAAVQTSQGKLTASLLRSGNKPKDRKVTELSESICSSISSSAPGLAGANSVASVPESGTNISSVTGVTGTTSKNSKGTSFGWEKLISDPDTDSPLSRGANSESKRSMKDMPKTTLDKTSPSTGQDPHDLNTRTKPCPRLRLEGSCTDWDCKFSHDDALFTKSRTVGRRQSGEADRVDAVVDEARKSKIRSGSRDGGSEPRLDGSVVSSELWPQCRD